MNRTMLLWVLVLFFGSGLLFAGLRALTEGQGAGVTLGVQLAALALLITAIVLIARRRR